MPWARFDDLRSGIAWQFDACSEVLVAWEPSQVLGVLEQVQRATDAGRWAFGYVGYEAASAFGPELVTHDRRPGDPPLVWFGLADAPRSVPVVAPVPDGARPTDRWWPEFTAASPAVGFVVTMLAAVAVSLVLASPPVRRVLAPAINPLGRWEARRRRAEAPRTA